MGWSVCQHALHPFSSPPRYLLQEEQTRTEKSIFCGVTMILPPPHTLWQWCTELPATVTAAFEFCSSAFNYTVPGAGALVDLLRTHGDTPCYRYLSSSTCSSRVHLQRNRDLRLSAVSYSFKRFLCRAQARGPRHRIQGSANSSGIRRPL